MILLTKFIFYVGVDFEDLFIGCNEHKIQSTEKLIDLAIDYYIFAFTTRVNNLLSGKISQPNVNNKIEVAAFQQNEKKKKKDKRQSLIINTSENESRKIEIF